MQTADAAAATATASSPTPRELAHSGHVPRRAENTGSADARAAQIALQKRLRTASHRWGLAPCMRAQASERARASGDSLANFLRRFVWELVQLTMGPLFTLTC